MSVIITNGQSWDYIAKTFTLAEEYAPALANYNNMEGESITGKRFRIEIPDSWMKPEYSGKEITLPAGGFSTTGGTGSNYPVPMGSTSIIPGVPNMVLLGAIGLLAVLALMPAKKR